jgi:urease subunit beta
MIPGEYLLDGPPIELNKGRPTCTIEVTNTGDRPVQIGAHYHFFEVNRALVFDREAAYGMRLDLPAGTAVRFEPGEAKKVQLVALGGQRRVYGGNALVMGPLDDAKRRQESLKRMRAAKFGDTAPPKADAKHTAPPKADAKHTAPPAKAEAKPVKSKPRPKARKKKK